MHNSFDCNQNATINERLYNDAQQRIEKNMKSAMSVRDIQSQTLQSDDPHTFHPVISDTSNILAKHNDMYRGDMKDFLARQDEFKARQMENKEKLRNQFSHEA